MRKHTEKIYIYFLVILLFSWISISETFADEPWIKYAPEGDWFSSLYLGFHSTGKTGDTLSMTSPTDSNYFIAPSLGRELFYIKKYATIEAEGMLAGHFGELDYHEYVIALNFRYHYFPWDNYLRTTLAFSEGISYSTRVMESDGLNKNLMNYMRFEATFGLPEYKKVDLIYGVHHRSGPNSVNYTGDSNFYVFGMRYKW